MRDNLKTYTNDFLDLALLSYTEQIRRDYTEFLKNAVLPELSEHYDIKIRDMRVLSYIDFSDLPVAASDVASGLSQDRASITRAVVTLIGEGYLTTSENFDDGRSRILHLTDKGQEICKLFRGIVSSSISKTETRYSNIALDESPERLINTINELRDRAAILSKDSLNTKRQREKTKK